MMCHEKLHVHTYSDKCGITALSAVKVGFLKRLHLSLLLIQKNWQQKAINSNTYFRQDQFYLFISCLKNAKKHQFSKSEWIFPSDFEFSFLAKFSDLLTSNEVISVLICISSVEVYRELQCKILRYDLLLCALRFSRK